VEVFDFGGPIADQMAFHAAPDRPAGLGVVAADDRVRGPDNEHWVALPQLTVPFTLVGVADRNRD
ncbi:MAG TPA: hypothetical protein VIH54_00560, partial [Chthoniobacterales bacterium]